jgi:hypothetical protein
VFDALRVGKRRICAVPTIHRLPFSHHGYAGSETFLVFHWAAKGTAKSLGFAPGVTNLFPKAGELVCYPDDDEHDHGYRPALMSR